MALFSSYLNKGASLGGPSKVLDVGPPCIFSFSKKVYSCVLPDELKYQ